MLLNTIKFCDHENPSKSMNLLLKIQIVQMAKSTASTTAFMEHKYIKYELYMKEKNEKKNERNFPVLDFLSAVFIDRI